MPRGKRKEIDQDELAKKVEAAEKKRKAEEEENLKRSKNPSKRPEVSNPLFEAVKAKDLFRGMTNFEESELLTIFDMCKFGVRKGAKSVVSDLDSVVALLAIMKSGETFENFAKGWMNLSSAAILHNSIKRATSVVLSALKEKWWENRIRPQLITLQGYEDSALIIDSTTIRVKRPSGSFEDSQALFDSKNHCYGVKKEVAVMSSKPHYALFVGNKYTGATNDYKIHKEISDSYLTYLKKTQLELNLINNQEEYWGVLVDKGYIGPAIDTIYKRVHPKKGKVEETQHEENVAISKARVHVERFFGRMKTLWANTVKFRYDLECFDDLFDLSVLLTNEHIKSIEDLKEKDKDFFDGLKMREEDQVIEKEEKKRESSKESYKISKERKKQQQENEKESEKSE